MTLSQRVARGFAVGVTGTAAMTAWQRLAAKLKRPPDDAEPPDPPSDPWEAASAPAKVAKKIGEDVLHRRVSPQRIPLLTNAMHWGYGTSWGMIYALGARRASRSSVITVGAAFGTGVWLMSYIQLVPMGLYDPPWETPAAEVALDLSYHLVYGMGVAGAYRLLDRG